MKIETQRERELVNYYLNDFQKYFYDTEYLLIDEKFESFKEQHNLNEPKETIKEFQEWLEDMTKQFNKKFL